MFSDLEVVGESIHAVIEGLGYEASVNTRGLAYIEGETRQSESSALSRSVSPTSRRDVCLRQGETVRKGKSCGGSAGGSTLALVSDPVP
ncbi:hypothetical protein OJ998_01035 [Solirubrobacter taibaiensis]|nr:hypothetical protein [Solirubrobacter taibaiensis]